jgi:hypothetical protein
MEQIYEKTNVSRSIFPNGVINLPHGTYQNSVINLPKLYLPQIWSSIYHKAIYKSGVVSLQQWYLSASVVNLPVFLMFFDFFVQNQSPYYKNRLILQFDLLHSSEWNITSFLDKLTKLHMIVHQQ